MWQALQRAGRSVAEYVVSPKAQARGWLLGRVQAARAWSDGVLSAVAQDVAAQPDGARIHILHILA